MGFHGKSVKEFFKVFIELSKVLTAMLSDIFKGGNMGLRDVSTGSVFAICNNVWWE